MLVMIVFPVVVAAGPVAAVVAAVVGLSISGVPMLSAVLIASSWVALVALLRPELVAKWAIRSWVVVSWRADARAASLEVDGRPPAMLRTIVRSDGVVRIVRPRPGQTMTDYDAAANRLSLRWGRPVTVEQSGRVVVLTAATA